MCYTVCLAVWQDFPHGFAPHWDVVGMLDEPIKDGIRHRGILKQAMPLIHRGLAGNGGCLDLIPVVDNFQQILTAIKPKASRPQSSSSKTWPAAPAK